MSWIDGFKRSLKGGKEMAKIEKIEDNASEEFQDFDGEPLEEKESAVVETRKKAKEVAPKREEQVEEDRFLVVRQQAMEGLYDRVSNKPIATDIWDALAIIINKLEGIERAVKE
jgi:hypothetical protein